MIPLGGVGPFSAYSCQWRFSQNFDGIVEQHPSFNATSAALLDSTPGVLYVRLCNLPVLGANCVFSHEKKEERKRLPVTVRRYMVHGIWFRLMASARHHCCILGVASAM